MQLARRTVLAGGAIGAVGAIGTVAAVTSGCGARVSASEHPDPALASALAAVAEVAALAASASAPQSTVLSWTAGIHARHAQLLAGLVGSAVPSVEASPVSTGTSAYGEVAQAERELVKTLRASCRDAGEPQVARLLASMAAAASQQAAILDGLA